MLCNYCMVCKYCIYFPIHKHQKYNFDICPSLYICVWLEWFRRNFHWQITDDIRSNFNYVYFTLVLFLGLNHCASYGKGTTTIVGSARDKYFAIQNIAIPIFVVNSIKSRSIDKMRLVTTLAPLCLDKTDAQHGACGWREGRTGRAGGKSSTCRTEVAPRGHTALNDSKLAPNLQDLYPYPIPRLKMSPLLKYAKIFPHT